LNYKHEIISEGHLDYKPRC